MVDTFPDPSDEKLVAVVSFFFDEETAAEGCETHEADELASQIYSRCTNRNVDKRKVLDAHTLEKLKAITQSIPDATLHLTDDVEAIKTLATIAGIADRLRFFTSRSTSRFVCE